MPRSFEIWQQRLTDAKRIWMDKGILGNESDSSMRMLIEFYRSNQWQNMMHWGGLEPEDLRIVNKIFPTANAQQAAISSRNPRVNYFPRSEDAQAAAKARAVKALHDYDIVEQKHKKQFNSAFRDHQFAPFGIVRHGYTPPDEIATQDGRRKRQRRLGVRRDTNPNRPWMRRIAPWNALMDPHCEAFDPDGGMRWCAFRDMMWKDDILANPNMTADRDKLKTSSGNIAREWLDMLDPAVRERSGELKSDAFEVWTVYEAEEDTWFQMTLSGFGDFLREPDDWPIPWETLPINVFCVNEQMDTPFALSLMENQLPLQQELNQVRTMIHQGVLRTRRFNIAAAGAFEDEEVTRMKNGDMSEFFMTKPGVGDAKSALATVQTGGLPQEAIQHMGIIQEDMREESGQSKMDRGQRINVESAAEAAFVDAGSSINEGRIEDAFIDFVTETESLYMQGRRHILKEVGEVERVRVVVDSDMGSLREFVDVDEEMLHGEYDFELVAGSTRRKDPNDEARKALADLNVALHPGLQNVSNVPLAYRKYIEARGQNPAEAINQEAHQLARVSQVVNTAREIATLGESTELPSIDPNLFAAFPAGQGGNA